MQQPVDTHAGAAALSLSGSDIDNEQNQIGHGQAGESAGGHSPAAIGAAVAAGSARELQLGSFNCRGYSDATLALVLELFSAGKPTILALQDLGGNHNGPSAARLAADTDLLAAAGIAAWHNESADNDVALLYSKTLQDYIFEKSSDNTHLASLQLEVNGQATQISTAYWRPTRSPRSEDITTAVLDLAIAGPGKQILLGDLNCCVASVQGRVVAQRNDTRSRAVARWLRDADLAPCQSEHTYRSGPFMTKIDHIIVPSAQIRHAETRWVADSDHALLTSLWTLPGNDNPHPPAQQAEKHTSFVLPAYGAYQWHVFGQQLSARMKALTENLPAEVHGDAALQTLADDLHNTIVATAKTCLQVKKYAGARQTHLPHYILRAKRALRKHLRSKQHEGAASAAFAEKTAFLRSALQTKIAQYKDKQSLTFAQKNAPRLQSLASRQAWGQVKKVMSKGRRNHTALHRNTEIHSMTKLFSKHTTIVLNEALTADLGDLFT